MATLIAIENLHYRYNQRTEICFHDFCVSKGESILLLGESGSGKTTLLHLLGGLIKPSGGKIIINDTDVTHLTKSKLDQFRAKHIGFIFQKNHLIDALTVRENLLTASFLAGFTQDEKRVEQVLAFVGILGKKNSKIHELSQGQAQRVAIARAILNKPSILLADELTSALDDKNCQLIADLLSEATHRSDTTTIIATHDQRLKSKFTKHIQL
jgi:ABC-type lipoprotein export system ATPase subunit